MFNKFRRFCCLRSCCRSCGCYGGRGTNTREAININEITYDELVKNVREGAILLDVRTRQEFLEGHLDGAILMPYYDIFRKVKNIIPNKDQAIIVYCQNGGRSLKAGDTLARLGYKNIYDLKGGIESTR